MDASVPGFLPSTHGLHYPNEWPSAPVRTIPIRFNRLGLHVSTAIPLGDASGGLCGGMTFAVRDLLEQRLRPPPDTDNPPPGSPAFEYLGGRLLASFGGLDNGAFGARYLEWMLLPDHSTHWPVPISPVTLPGVVDRTITQTLPAVQRVIDAEKPAPLGLVCAHIPNPAELPRRLGDLKLNHQVLAYAYYQQNNDVVLRLYDTNLPDRDDVALTCHLNDRTTARFECSDSRHAVRGFFLSDYSPADPAALFQVGPL
jgi:hypothetical protein